MKKTVVTCGLLSGAVSALMMVLTFPFIERMGFDRAITVGLHGDCRVVPARVRRRSPRGRSGGRLTFGRGFTVGILITLISCVFSVATSQVIYFSFVPDFADRWAAYSVEKVRASGGSQAEIDATVRQMEEFKKMQDNPLINAGFTFVEPFPIRLVMTLIAAVALRTKDKPHATRDVRNIPLDRRWRRALRHARDLEVCRSLSSTQSLRVRAGVGSLSAGELKRHISALSNEICGQRSSGSSRTESAGGRSAPRC